MYIATLIYGFLKKPFSLKASKNEYLKNCRIKAKRVKKVLKNTNVSVGKQAQVHNKLRECLHPTSFHKVAINIASQNNNFCSFILNIDWIK